MDGRDDLKSGTWYWKNDVNVELCGDRPRAAQQQPRDPRQAAGRPQGEERDIPRGRVR